MAKLLLGPIVGHTDTASSRVWVRVDGDVAGWSLEVDDGASIAFVATDPERNEFGTAIATVEGLQADTLHTYHVVFGGQIQAVGSFRTMPDAASREEVTFVTLSCNDSKGAGAWPPLAQLVSIDPPRFLLMIGDQVYLDDEDDDLWPRFRDAEAEPRRRAFAAKYQAAWSKQPVASIMANTPTYMMWDDHDIRDGWGSSAGDSPTLAARYPRGAAIHGRHRAWLEDARDVYFHFQACRNPDGARVLEGAAPFTLRCGRLLVVVLDQSTERDFARPADPVLGAEQWQWLTIVVDSLGDDVDAIALANGIPVVDLHADSVTHRLFRDRTDDIKPFARGDEEALEKVRTRVSNKLLSALCLLLAKTVDPGFRVGRWLGIGSAETDDGRDRWSFPTNRPEQERLLKLMASAAMKQRPQAAPRALVYLGGDIHVGALFDVKYSRPPFVAQCVITSGISQTQLSLPEVKAGVLDERFEVFPGLEAERLELVTEQNFALTKVEFGPDGAKITNAFIREDESIRP